MRTIVCRPWPPTCWDRFPWLKIPVSWTVSWRRMIPIGTVRCWTWRPTCWDNGPVHTGVGFSECASTAALSIDCYRPLSACVHVECPTGTDRLPSYPQKPSDVPRHASHGGHAHPSGMGYTLSPFSHGRPVPPDLSRPSFLTFSSREGRSGGMAFFFTMTV